MLLRRALMAAIAFVLLVPAASAQTYPDHSVKIIVPVGPAGSYDLLGRLVADQLTKRMGQSFVVENRPGAGSVTGTRSVATAPPDGYTLVVGGLSNIVFNIGLYKNLPFNPQTDLVPVALIMNISYTLVGNKDVPYSSPKELIAAAKKNPGSIKVANAGVGTGQHVVGAAFQAITGTKLLEVPYRGSSLAYPDVLGGRVDLFFEFDAGGAALCQIGPGQGHCHPHGEAASRYAERAHHDRVGRAGSRNRFLDRHFCAGQDADDGDRAAAEGDRGGVGGDEAAPRHDGR